MKGAVIFFCALVFALPVMAQQALPPAPYAYRQLDNPRLEARARVLMHELRCLVCQGQSIADSDAPMAGDMRSQVRERIAAGQNPDEIRAWLVERYGAWVTYDPPFAGGTAVLWLMPLAALLVGGWLALGRLRARGHADSKETEA
jgi:cytochrome c-type biogenesis protein CcmH